FDTMTFQGNNGLAFALIALDSSAFEVPENAKWSRQEIIEELLNNQNEDGSWSLNNLLSTPNIDITAMVLTGICPYQDQPEIDKALNDAVEWLSYIQADKGGFEDPFVGGITSEATSQVIIGLTANNIDPTGESFTKNGDSLIDHLLTFRNDDGGFKHTLSYDNSDSMATEQALQALVAYDLFLNGNGKLYQFDLENSERSEEHTSE